MGGKVKDAVIMTATVLVVIYVANQISITRDLVRRAMAG